MPVVVVTPKEIVPPAAFVGAPKLLVGCPPLTLLSEPMEMEPAFSATGPVKLFEPEIYSGWLPVPVLVNPPGPLILPPMLILPVILTKLVPISVMGPFKLAEKLLPFAIVALFSTRALVMLFAFGLNVVPLFIVIDPVPNILLGEVAKERLPALTMVPPL